MSYDLLCVWAAALDRWTDGSLDKWMAGWISCVICPFQQYFSHIRTMDNGYNERLCVMIPRLRLERVPLQEGSDLGSSRIQVLLPWFF